MKIAIDLQSCQSGSRHGGIGRYSSDLAKAMIQEGSGHEFIIVLNNLHPDISESLRYEFQGFVAASNIITFHIPKNIAFIKDNHEIRRRAEDIRQSFLSDLKVDAVHVTSLFEGLHDEIAVSIPYSSSRSYLTAVTLYDLIPHEQREAYLRDHRARSHYYDKMRDLPNAECILAISQFSADEFKSNFPEYRGLLANISGGLDPNFRKIESSYFKSNEIFRKNTISREYILYTASFDQRKNHAGLIEAFAMLPDSVRNKYSLVFVGNGWPQIYEHFWRIGEKFGLDRTQIIFTGRVNDEELIALYNSCKLFVFPSHWEGLGMPPVEAMACGAPVIGSNTTSIREVIGLEEAMFDPFKTSQIANKLLEALTNKKFIDLLKAHGEAHSSKFRWDKSAKIALEAIEQAASSRKVSIGRSGALSRHTDVSYSHKMPALPLLNSEVSVLKFCDQLNKIETQAERKERRIKTAWISSFGTRCGIASYSERLIPFFDDEIRILAPFVDEGFAESGNGCASANQYDVVRCWTAGKSDPLDELSAEVELFQPSRIIIQFNFGFFDLQALAGFMRDQSALGRKIYIVMHSTVDQSIDQNQRLPSILNELSSVTCIFVHTQADLQRLSVLGINDGVVCLPQGVVNFKPNQRVKKASSAVTIASYGFFLPGKGLPELVEAIKILRNDQHHIKLLMINANYSDPYGISRSEIEKVRNYIGLNGLEDVVDLNTAYLEEEESINFLRNADLIVFPYQKTGESSSAAVRTGLTAGIPVAVTPVSIFDDIRSLVYTLPGSSPSEMAVGISDVLGELANGSARVDKVQRAKNWCDINDVSRVAKHFIKSIRKASEREKWLVAYKAEVQSLPVIDGIYNGRTISCPADAGTLIYGPYLDLSKGSYALTVLFNSVEYRNVSGTVTISSDAGGCVLASRSLSSSAPTFEMFLNFYLPAPTVGLEIVITGGDTPFEVLGYILRKKEFSDLINWSDHNPSATQLDKNHETCFSLKATVEADLIDGSDEGFISSIYRQYLNRAPEPMGMAHWLEQLESGRDTREGIIEKVKKSDEYTNFVSDRAMVR